MLAEGKLEAQRPVDDIEESREFKPLLTKNAEIKLQALKHVRQFLIDSTLPDGAILARTTRKLASRMELKHSKIWWLK